jgi:hypothetical protein
MNAPAHLDFQEIFEAGVWALHLQDQNNRTARVQGVRFFFHNTAPDSVEASSTHMLMRGDCGYICVLARSVSVEANGVLYTSLEAIKPALQSGKAWDTNRKAYHALADAIVPVIYMTTGRPKDRRFGVQDCFLGLFRVQHIDPSVLSARLSPVASACGLISTQRIQEAVRERLGEEGGRPPKRRRREIPVYHCAGSQMGAAGSIALTGAHCKDLWIQSVQRATVSLRINA